MIKPDFMMSWTGYRYNIFYRDFCTSKDMRYLKSTDVRIWANGRIEILPPSRETCRNYEVMKITTANKSNFFNTVKSVYHPFTKEKLKKAWVLDAIDNGALIDHDLNRAYLFAYQLEWGPREETPNNAQKWEIKIANRKKGNIIERFMIEAGKTIKALISLEALTPQQINEMIEHNYSYYREYDQTYLAAAKEMLKLAANGASPQDILVNNTPILNIPPTKILAPYYMENRDLSWSAEHAKNRLKKIITDSKKDVYAVPYLNIGE